MLEKNRALARTVMQLTSFLLSYARISQYYMKTYIIIDAFLDLFYFSFCTTL